MTISPDVWVMGSGVIIGLLLGYIIRMDRRLFSRREWDWNAECDRIKNLED